MRRTLSSARTARLAVLNERPDRWDVLYVNDIHCCISKSLTAPRVIKTATLVFRNAIERCEIEYEHWNAVSSCAGVPPRHGRLPRFGRAISAVEISQLASRKWQASGSVCRLNVDHCRISSSAPSSYSNFYVVSVFDGICASVYITVVHFHNRQSILCDINNTLSNISSSSLIFPFPSSSFLRMLLSWPHMPAWPCHFSMLSWTFFEISPTFVVLIILSFIYL